MNLFAVMFGVMDSVLSLILLLDLRNLFQYSPVKVSLNTFPVNKVGHYRSVSAMPNLAHFIAVSCN